MKKFCSVMVALICVCSSFLYAFADTPSELPLEADGSGYARDYLLEGESWLCEEHAVIYDPAFPDNVCYRCWKDAQDAQEFQSYSVSPYSLANSLDESGISTLAETSDGTTIQDNQFNPAGVVCKTGSSSWTHMTYNTEGDFYVGSVKGFQDSAKDYQWFYFGFQQMQSLTYDPYTWVVFAIAPNGENTALNKKTFAYRVGTSYVDASTAVPRTVTAQGNDGKWYYAFQLGSSSLTGDYFTFRVKGSTVPVHPSGTLELSQIQLYSGTADDQSPPAGWYSGDPNYSGGGDTPTEPTDIDKIGGWFSAVFEWLANIRDNIVNGFSGLASSLSSGFSNLMDTVSNAAGSIVSGLTVWWDEQFSGAVNPDIDTDSGSIDSTLQEQEQIEAPFWDGLQDSSEQWAQQDLSIPLDVANSITFVLTCFTGIFDGLGAYKPVFLFVPAVGIALALLGRMGSVIPGASRAVIRESRKKEGA